MVFLPHFSPKFTAELFIFSCLSPFLVSNLHFWVSKNYVFSFFFLFFLVGELSTSFCFFSRFPQFFANFSPVDLLHFPPKPPRLVPGVSPSAGSDPSRRPTTAWRHTSSSSAAVSVGAWWMTSWSLRCWWACSNHRRSEKHWDRTYIEGVQKWMVYIIVENPVKIDDLEVPPFQETSIYWF